MVAHQQEPDAESHSRRRISCICGCLLGSCWWVTNTLPSAIVVPVRGFPSSEGACWVPARGSPTSIRARISFPSMDFHCRRVLVRFLLVAHQNDPERHYRSRSKMSIIGGCLLGSCLRLPSTHPSNTILRQARACFRARAEMIAGAVPGRTSSAFWE